MPSRLIGLVLLASLTGCASLSPPQKTEAVASIPLAQPIGPTRRVVQQLTAIWPGKQESLMCVLELDKQHIAIAGLSNEGISLFNLTYDGKKLVLEKSPLLLGNFSPEWIIKDLQLVYWPVAELTQLLPKQWRLEADTRHRRLYFDNEKRVDVTYLQPDARWPKTVDLTNHHDHYQLHIETVSYEVVPE